jgi:hypothetical protein
MLFGRLSFKGLLNDELLFDALFDSSKSEVKDACFKTSSNFFNGQLLL